ncbi:pentatricopeptide repeat-containing protein At3g21470 [Mercurialis annua]|uniref:pentatricopeptide repeat-containing protein At3g21470 n=1 Tax=Mercurialis annua TaxID=3986 RepID=UPI00215F9997|nr:pentatricopeptide repeat-containing protein At3g21470 [Mercurialis annua]
MINNQTKGTQIKILKKNSTKTIPDQPNWSCIIRNYLSQGSHREALVLYNQIPCRGAYLLGLVPLVLKACASSSDLTYGKSLHTEVVKKGVDFDVVIGTSLITMYAKCGDIVDARKLFDYMPDRNVVTWNAMVGGYIRNGDVKSPSGLFERMSVKTTVTWIEMIDGFARNGDLVGARSLFDQVPLELKNVVTWTVMVDGYASKGNMTDARVIFEMMPQRNFFVWSSMISGYCKLGEVEEARAIFDRIPIRNLVNWNSLICGYAQNGFCEQALEAFGSMQVDGFEPDEVTIVSVLSACAQLGLLDVGKDVHQMVYDKGIKLNQFVMNALVDMYAKCGDLTTARSIFEGMCYKNKSCWNAMISGFAIHGQCSEALGFFRRMEESNESPDKITYLSVLSACAHGGFVDEGLEIFSKMEKCELAVNIKHYGCMVDLLGRAGRLQDAYDFIKRMQMKPNDVIWGSLLGACRVHFNMDMAEKVMEEVNRKDYRADSGNDPHSLLLSNIYAASDSWEKAESMRMVTMNKRLPKTPGRSSVMPLST